MAKRPATKSENNEMTNENLDPLADLGLDADAATETAAEDTAQENTEVARQTEMNINFDGIKRERVKELPATTRSGGGGSRFPFAELEAPNKEGYDTFFVPYSGGDKKKFQRTVQSATTQANQSNKEAGKYFESRSITEDGKFTGIMVSRTDNRPADKE